MMDAVACRIWLSRAGFETRKDASPSESGTACCSDRLRATRASRPSAPGTGSAAAFQSPVAGETSAGESAGPRPVDRLATQTTTGSRCGLPAAPATGRLARWDDSEGGCRCFAVERFRSEASRSVAAAECAPAAAAGAAAGARIRRWCGGPGPDSDGRRPVCVWRQPAVRVCSLCSAAAPTRLRQLASARRRSRCVYVPPQSPSRSRRQVNGPVAGGAHSGLSPAGRPTDTTPLQKDGAGDSDRCRDPGTLVAPPP